MVKLDGVETKAVDFIAKVMPWAACFPTAYLVGRSSVQHLGWPGFVGVIAALVVETLGLSSTATALELFEFNRNRRKTDNPAPFALAAFLVVTYFVTAVALTISLDIFPTLSKFAPAIFPVLSLVGVTIVALRTDHQHRLNAIAEERAARKEERKAQRSMKQHVQGDSKTVSKPVQSGHRLDKAREALKAKANARLDALLDALAGNPEMSVTEAAQLLNCSRQTIYSCINALTKSGRLQKKGDGWVILEK